MLESASTTEILLFPLFAEHVPVLLLVYCVLVLVFPHNVGVVLVNAVNTLVNTVDVTAIDGSRKQYTAYAKWTSAGVLSLTYICQS